ncbi:hypothetical protein AGLY_001641 [Aphis glycines]|uniref:Uncharacterized protein n=1 Tax=Aphis glycines TaxID=307491 RepID=A0A6G0U6P2_APHGL|nr:hypothetical protein AGLY_001641 [Aphis glycines]
MVFWRRTQCMFKLPVMPCFCSVYKTLLLNNLISSNVHLIQIVRIFSNLYCWIHLKKKNKTVFKNRHHCLKQLCAKNVTNEHNLISARDYNTQRLSLKYSSSSFRSLVQKIVSYIGQQVQTILHHINIRKTLCDNIKNNFDFKNISLCSNHGDNFEIKIIQNIVNLLVNYWCTEVNRILLEKKTLHCDETES